MRRRLNAIQGKPRIRRRSVRICSYGAISRWPGAIPPLTLAFGFGFDFVSDMRWPGSFDGGGAGETPRDFGVEVPEDAVDVGSWRASDAADKPNVLGLAGLALELPAM